MSRNSITPACAFSATSEVICVLTTIPSVKGIAQDGCGFGIPSISTKHIRQAATGAREG